jgi:O-antigen/teichoic acid export membrane protein
VTDQRSNELPGGAGGVAASSAAKPRWQDRVGVGFWSLADQGAVSLGNFATTILLARAMSPRDFGVFALIFGMLIFLNNLHGALITYPLSVHGAAADDNELRRLTWLALALTLALGVPVGIGVGLIAWAFKLGRLTPWLVAAMLLWQVQETLRRALMAHLRYQDAIWGDGVSYLGQALVIVFLAHSGRLSPATIFATIAGTSAIGALLQWAQLRLFGAFSLSGLVLRARDCWELGRWTAAGNLAGIANIQAVPWALAAFHGAAEAGKLVASASAT